MAYKGNYKLINPSKYIGDPTSINWKSLWERKVCRYLDLNENIIRWGYEPVKIPYFSHVHKKIKKYIPDFIVETKRKDGSIETTVLEVKPLSQSVKPQMGKKQSKKSFLRETIQYEVNQAKWKQAKRFCDQQGWLFKVVTEKDLFK